MSTVPAWLAAAAAQPAQAGQINQFLGTHGVNFLYAAALQAQANTAGSGSSGSNGLWLAQNFATGAGQTKLGRVVLNLSVTGTPGPATVGIYATSGGLPTGAALVTAQLPREFVGASAGAVSIPLPCTVTASTTYAIVIQAVGSVGNQYSWSKNNVGSGASTSATGSSWTAQAYGLMYQQYDQAATGSLAHTWEDAGARWTGHGYNASGQLTSLQEYTVAQAAGYLASSRAFTYTGNLLTGIA